MSMKGAESLGIGSAQQDGKDQILNRVCSSRSSKDSSHWGMKRKQFPVLEGLKGDWTDLSILTTRRHRPCEAELSEVISLGGRKQCTPHCNGPRICSLPHKALYCTEFEQP